MIFLRKSYRKDKKYMVTINNKTIHFGATGYSDFTEHKNIERKKRYISRHSANENWKNIYSSGFWARYILWNKPTLMGSIRDTNKRFGLQIKYVK